MPTRVSAAAAALLALAVVAFWRPYLSRPQTAGAAVHLHAALGTAWLLLLMVQPLLAGASRRAAHRMLGRAGAVLGTAFVITGVVVAQRSVARMSDAQFALEGRFVYLPLAMAALFAASLALALVWRASPAVHARFMAATLLALLDPVIARLLYFYAPPLPAEMWYQAPAFVLIVVALVAMARSLPPGVQGRRAFDAFAGGAVVVLLGFLVVPGTVAWWAFVTWLRALPTG